MNETKTAKAGDSITIEGVNEGLRKQLLIGSINPLTGRKCKVIGPMTMVLRAPVVYGSKVSNG